MQFLLYFGILFVGMCIGYALRHWLSAMQTYSGILRVIKGEGKTIYSLELKEDPELLAFKPEVVFKVVTLMEENSDRE